MVDKQHDQYKQAAEDWDLVRACIEGERAVKDAGTNYLPKPNGFNAEQYQEYLTRADYFNATGRTVDGLTGLVLRKRPLLSGSEIEAVIPLQNNATRSGKSILDLAEETVDEVIKVGRAGLLVDYPRMDDESGSITIAEAQRIGLRPYVRLYPAEAIINWRMTVINGEEVLTMVVLREEHEAEGESEYDTGTSTKYRVLTLEDSESESRYYRIRLIRIEESHDLGELVRVEVVELDTVARRNGESVREIPFVFVGTVSTMPDIQKSPIIDVARANLSHYRTSADIEWGAHKSALPTFVITGHDRDASDGPLYIGADTAMTLREPDAKAFFLEFTGAGMGVLLSLEQAKRDRMAVLGARMLEADKRMVESAETAMLHRQGEHATLSSIAHTVSDAITRQLRTAALWNGATPDQVEEIELTLNTDYFPHPITSADMLAIMRTWQEGGVTWAELTEYLQRGEIADPAMTPDERREAIDTDPSRLRPIFGGGPDEGVG